MADLTVSSDVDGFMAAASKAAMRTALDLGNVNNTTDLLKPVSTATRSELLKSLPKQPIISTIGNSLVSDVATVSFAQAFGSVLGGINVQQKGVNGAVSSALVGQVANLPTDANTVVIHEGSNDAASGVSLATHRANILAAINAVLDSGRTPIVIASAPRDGYALLTAQYALVERFLCESNGVLFADPWSSETATNGNFIADQSDSTHPYGGPAARVGENAARIILGLDPNYAWPRGNTLGTGLHTNVLMQTDTNADGVPDGWAINETTCTIATSLIDNTYPNRGKRFRCELSGTSSQFAVISIAGSVDLSTVTTGDMLRLTGLLSVSNITGNVRAVVLMQHNDVQRYGCAIARNVTNLPFATQAPKAASTSLIQLLVNPSGASWTANIELSCVDLINMKTYTG